MTKACHGTPCHEPEALYSIHPDRNERWHSRCSLKNALQECEGLWEVVGVLRLLPTPNNSHSIILLGISKAFGLALYLKYAKAIESAMATKIIPMLHQEIFLEVLDTGTS